MRLAGRKPEGDAHPSAGEQLDDDRARQVVQLWGGIVPEGALTRALGHPVTLACLSGVPGVYTDEVIVLADDARRRWVDTGSACVPEVMALPLPHLLAVSETTPVTDVVVHRALATQFDDVDRTRSAYHEALSAGTRRCPRRRCDTGRRMA